MNKMAGRKPKYNDDLLLDELEKYLEKQPYIKIKLSELEKSTGIPYYIWRDNKKIRQVIKKMNENPAVQSRVKKDIVFPSAERLVEANYNNKKKLIESIQYFIDVLNDIYDKAIIGENFVKERDKLETVINNKNSEIKKLENKILKLENEIDILYIKSSNKEMRNEMGLKGNLIKFNKNSKQLSKDLKDIEKEFSGLFD